MRLFEIDYTKVKTIKDMGLVLKSLQLVIKTDEDDVMSWQFEEIYKKGFLKEIENKEAHTGKLS